MKTRTWILIFTLLAFLCGILCLALPSGQAATARVYSNGVLIQTIDLSQEAVYRIETENGWNELTVSDGMLCVSAASCPSQDCVHRGAVCSGLPVVCLPNALLIQFSSHSALDAMLG